MKANRIQRTVCCLMAAAVMIICGGIRGFAEQDPGGRPENGWWEEEGKKYYYRNGEKCVSCRIEADGKQYLLDENGTVLTGVNFSDEDGTFWLSAESGEIIGEVVDFGWNEINGERYYIRNDGTVMPPGLHYVEWVACWFGANGLLLRGRIVEDVALNPDGTIVTHGWYSLNGENYYVDSETGKIVRGATISIDNVLCTFDADGKLIAKSWGSEEDPQAETPGNPPDDPDPPEDRPEDPGDVPGNGSDDTGGNLPSTIPEEYIIPLAVYAVQREGEKYYYDDRGILLTGVVMFDDRYYLCALDGTEIGEILEFGWNEICGEHYYIRSNGTVMPKGKNYVRWEPFYFGENGRMLHDMIVDDHILAADGRVISEGWCELDGARYYVNKETTRILRDTVVSIENRLYCFDEEGKLWTGYREHEGEQIWFDENGVLLTEDETAQTSDPLQTENEDNDEDFLPENEKDLEKDQDPVPETEENMDENKEENADFFWPWEWHERFHIETGVYVRIQGEWIKLQEKTGEAVVLRINQTGEWCLEFSEEKGCEAILLSLDHGSRIYYYKQNEKPEKTGYQRIYGENMYLFDNHDLRGMTLLFYR